VTFLLQTPARSYVIRSARSGSALRDIARLCFSRESEDTRLSHDGSTAESIGRCCRTGAWPIPTCDVCALRLSLRDDWITAPRMSARRQFGFMPSRADEHASAGVISIFVVPSSSDISATSGTKAWQSRVLRTRASLLTRFRRLSITCRIRCIAGLGIGGVMPNTWPADRKQRQELAYIHHGALSSARHRIGHEPPIPSPAMQRNAAS